MKNIRVGDHFFDVAAGWFSNSRRGYWVHSQDDTRHYNTRVERDTFLGMLCEDCPTARCEHTMAAELYEARYTKSKEQ